MIVCTASRETHECTEGYETAHSSLIMGQGKDAIQGAADYSSRGPVVLDAVAMILDAPNPTAGQTLSS